MEVLEAFDRPEGCNDVPGRPVGRRSSGPEPAAADDLKSRAVPGDPAIVSGDQSRLAVGRRRDCPGDKSRRVKSVDIFALGVSGGGTIMHGHNGSHSRPDARRSHHSRPPPLLDQNAAAAVGIGVVAGGCWPPLQVTLIVKQRFCQP